MVLGTEAAASPRTGRRAWERDDLIVNTWWSSSLATSKVGHLVMGWLGIAARLGDKPAEKGYIARIERVPTINRILDDLDAEMPKAA